MNAAQMATSIATHPVRTIAVALVAIAALVAADNAWTLPIVAVATLIVVTLTLATYFFQLIAMRETVAESTRQRHLESMLAVTNLLQSDEQRRSRGRLLESTKQYRLHDGPEPDPANTDYAFDCDNIGHVMQTLGFYTKNQLFEQDLVISNWCHAVSECWKAAEPYVRQRRDEERWEVWADFEWLANQADAWLEAARGAAPAARPTEADGAQQAE